MKTPTLILTAVLLATTTFAGVTSLITQKKATWDFIQKTGGIAIVETNQNHDGSTVKFKYDPTGLTTVTQKPETMNSGLAVKKIEIKEKDGNLFAMVTTSTPDKSTGNGIIHEVEIPDLRNGTYPVFYGELVEAERKIGAIIIEGKDR